MKKSLYIFTCCSGPDDDWDDGTYEEQGGYDDP
jgi:hypothetical protein